MNVFPHDMDDPRLWMYDDNLKRVMFCGVFNYSTQFEPHYQTPRLWTSTRFSFPNNDINCFYPMAVLFGLAFCLDLFAPQYSMKNGEENVASKTTLQHFNFDDVVARNDDDKPHRREII